MPAAKEMEVLQEELAEKETHYPSGYSLGSEVDDEQDGNIVDDDLYTRVGPFKFNAAPGVAKAIAEGGSPAALPRTFSGDFQRAMIGDGMSAQPSLKPPDSEHPPPQPEPGRASARSADPKCETMASLAPTERLASLEEDAKGEKYDFFLSHLQRNAQDTIISLQMFLKESRPGLKFFIDVDVDMTDGLHETLRRGVLNCRCFLFFITDGILTSMWCAQELRWAVEYGKNIVLVRETDERHGGIEMKDFFAQVPEDLMPVFKNNIAIPWYREKGFRGVSVESILKRANLEDEHANALQKLKASKQQMMAIVKLSQSSATAFDVIQRRSVTLKIVLWIGGFATFKSKCVQRVYDIIFNLSFWTCGTLCALNLFYRDIPYHNLPTDMLTAYVHLPAWQSWIVWRRFVRSDACALLLSKAKANPEREAKLNLVLRFGGWLVLIVQCAMVADVLMGFSYPRTAQLAGKHEMHEFTTFESLHALMMWLIIPPVIAAMFASYVMFAFVAALHLLDIFATKDLLSKCIEPLAGYYDDPKDDDGPVVGNRRSGEGKKITKKAATGEHITPRDKATPRRDGSEGASSIAESSEVGSAIGDAMDNLQEFQRQAALEESLFRTVAELLVFLIDGAQARIDATSDAIGGLWVHLVFFSTAQVLAISTSLEALGTGHASSNYLWWWGLQDFFHLGGGLVLLLAAMGVFCIVTAVFNRVPRGVFKLLAGAGVPVSRQASVVSLLGTRPLGMRVAFGFILVDPPKAAGFFFVLCVLLMDKLMIVLAILTEYEHS